MPKRKLRIDNIYNMDCLLGMKMIPDGTIDLVVTDPPYLFIKGGMKSKSLNVGTKASDNYINTDMADFDGDKITQLLNSLQSKFRHGYNAYFFSSELQIVYYLKYALEHKLRYNLLVWDRGLSNMISYKFFRSHIDYIVRIYKGNSLNKVQGDNPNELYGKIKHGKKPKTFHDAAKPVELIRDLIKLSSNEGDLIFDPFMGSGTTAIAAIREKRHFIGFELNKEYFDKTIERIENETKIRLPK